ncbi:thiol reductant ABC exporter subunit CydC [Propioniciclava sp. MC1595]|uniref:thiol reductant ABC exporter subunit CydC n=1 Tax=Propioniciclava sp. MC1595 TaxID=2760308 RepID=UPI0016622ED8|nr:thiol reductant ABC exporter subunit CydC [Propioniciclava sp. MC1595]MBB1495408.1 thiol reductant ABC exporter subunit CydC [Propioniciclava sp. MC1595]QTE26580.1 thiol reductant ABC exporter subunit CydC [Propioniciclava sp. MC1595]
MIDLLTRLLRATPSGGPRIALAVLLAFLASFSSVALMGVSGWLLSRAAEHPPVMYLTAAAVMVRAFGISRGVFRYLERLVGHDVGLRLQSALRLDTYATLARTTLLGRRRGDLLTRVVADVDAVLDLVVRVLLPFLSGLFVILATTVVIGVFAWPAAVALLLSALVAGALAPWLAARLSAQADAASLPARGELANVVHELARTAPDLVAYGADTAALDRLTTADARLRDIDARAAWTRGLATAVQTLAAGLAVVTGLWFGTQAVRAGTLDHTMLAVLTLVPLALHEVFNDFTKAAQTAARARVALARVREVLDAPPVGSGDRATAERSDAPHLAVHDLAIGWPGAAPLASGIDLEVGPGESVALVGPSGVGKTTLAATALGLIPAVAGTVEVEGRVGYLAQDAHVFSTSVTENVKIGNRDATGDDVAAALDRVRLDLSPDRLVGELGTALSGGEQRRLALARLVVGEYQVLVLDEPSEHLDPETADALLDDVWASASGLPLLVITHDPAVVARCDRVVHLG